VKVARSGLFGPVALAAACYGWLRGYPHAVAREVPVRVPVSVAVDVIGEHRAEPGLFGVGQQLR
jgi:hypothetical protein